jgi:hypothetical protein
VNSEAGIKHLAETSSKLSRIKGCQTVLIKVLFVEIKLDVVIEDDLMLLDVRLVIEVLSNVKGI